MASVPLFAPGRWTQLGIADALTDRLIGDLGVHISADGRDAALGFTLARAAQGRGLASAAVRMAITLVFEQTAAERIHAQTDARNAACVRLLERLSRMPPQRIDATFRGVPCVELRYELARR